MRRRSEASQFDPRSERSERERPAPKGKSKAGPGEVRVPHDPVNEQVIIAAAIVDHDVRAKLVHILPADSFFGKGHSEAWGVVTELERRKLAYDPATVRQLSGGAVDTDYLDRLIEQRPAVPPNLSFHVECLHWDRARVEAVRGPIGSLLESLRDPTSEPERVRALARQVGGAFEGAGGNRYLRDPAALHRDVMTSIRKRRAGHAIYPYGLPGFDRYADGEFEGAWRIVPGMAPKQVTVLTGVPGSGKTTVTCRIAVEQANLGRRVLYGAWEQGSEATIELCAITSLGLSRTRFETGEINDEEEALVSEEVERLAQYLRFFEIPFGRRQGEKQINDKNLDVIHGYIEESGCDVFIADLWRRALRQFDPDEEEIALYRQQAIAQETNTHCVLIHQQRAKDVEQRPDKRPTRDALKGSGAWIEVPDTIIGVHRPYLWKAVDDVTIEAIILKQRHGRWPLAVEFDWDPDTGGIINGHCIEYVRPGEKGSIEAFLEEARAEKQIEKKGGRRGRSSTK